MGRSSSLISAAWAMRFCRPVAFRCGRVGLKVEVPVSDFLFTAAYTQASNGRANLRAPWSGYPGYTSVQVQDFNRAGENAFLFRIGYDFPCVPGLSAYALAVFGGDPEDPSPVPAGCVRCESAMGAAERLFEGSLSSGALRRRPTTRGQRPRPDRSPRDR